jgi:hypothetical protein
MKRAVCPRSFEAEAMRDGRLTGAALAAFARHAGGCSACAREVRVFEALADALRALPAGEADDLRALRARSRLLAAFDADLVAPPRRWPRRLVWASAAAAILVGVAAGWRPHAPGPPAPSVAVVAGGGASWSRRPGDHREIVTLARGTLSIHVDHVAGAGRLLIELPDGELEDVGTTFTVSAASGRTTGVSVQEGSVVLRLLGLPTITIAAGETWRPHERQIPAAEPPRPVLHPDEPVRPAERRAMRPRAVADAIAASDPARDFRAAVSALDAGDARRAADAFAEFLADHPEDPRAEDAAYLEIIALQRCGDGVRLKEAAQRYLLRHQGGFRRAEVERLSR